MYVTTLQKETHTVDGEEKQLMVHRKGATTRAMQQGVKKSQKPTKDRSTCLDPGSMGTSSYILSGGEKSLMSFGSTAHGAGRLKSRTQAKQDYWGRRSKRAQKRRYPCKKAASGSTIAEEAPGVYKDVDEVIRVSDELGIGQKVARMKPIVNIKG